MKKNGPKSVMPEPKTIVLGDGLPRLLRRDFGAIAEMEERLGVAAAVGGDLKMGNLKAMAELAYCLNVTDREDRGEELTFAQFKKLFPSDVEEVARIGEIVMGLLNPPEASPRGNAE